ncbi:MAG: hypothetical protein WCR29_04195 [Bacteroidales bacterium]|nr:hypothetical protein [Bacteroidales bacterium]
MKKDLKLIIRNILILLTILIVIDIIVGILFTTISNKVVDKNPSTMITEYTIEKVNTDIIILGSSRANRHYSPSIIEKKLKLTTYNCGKSNQLNFNYSAAMFDALVKRYTPKLVIFDIEPIILDKAFAKEYNLPNELNHYYFKNNLFKEIVNNADPTERIKILSSMYRYNSRFIYIFDQLLAPKNNIYHGYVPLKNKGYKQKIQYKSYQKEGEIDQFIVSLLKRTIVLAKEKNIKLIFSISPQYQSSNYSQTKSYKLLQQILNDQKIPLINNSNTTLISDPNDYNDIMHLNQRGADKFSEKFAEQVIKQL